MSSTTAVAPWLHRVSQQRQRLTTPPPHSCCHHHTASSSAAGLHTSSQPRNQLAAAGAKRQALTGCLQTCRPKAAPTPGQQQHTWCLPSADPGRTRTQRTASQPSSEGCLTEGPRNPSRTLVCQTRCQSRCQSRCVSHVLYCWLWVMVLLCCAGCVCGPRHPRPLSHTDTRMHTSKGPPSPACLTHHPKLFKHWPDRPGPGTAPARTAPACTSPPAAAAAGAG